MKKILLLTLSLIAICISQIQARTVTVKNNSSITITASLGEPIPLVRAKISAKNSHDFINITNNEIGLVALKPNDFGYSHLIPAGDKDICFQFNAKPDFQYVNYDDYAFTEC